MTYDEQQRDSYETQVKLMSNGFVRILQEDKGTTVEEMCEYICTLNGAVIMYKMYKDRVEGVEDAQ